VAAPVVEGVAETAVSTAGTSHAVTLPASIAASDLVLIIMDIGSTSATLNALTDWTESLDEALANGLKIIRYTGTGVPSTPTFISTAATRSASIAYRISGADKGTAPQIATTASGTSATPDPPSITPTGGVSKDYLSITFYGAAGEEADDDTWSDTPPTNWTPSPPRQKACGVAGTNLGGMIAAAERAITTGSAIDPGTFAKDVSAAWRAQHILIHPAAAVELDLSPITVTVSLADLTAGPPPPEVSLSPVTVTASLGTVVLTPTVAIGAGTGDITLTAGTPFEATGSVTESTGLTLPSGLADGDYTILFCCLNSSTGTISPPAGWDETFPDAQSTASTSHVTAIYSRKWQSGDTDPVVTCSSGRLAVLPVKVSGADASTLVEGTVGSTSQASATTSVDAPSQSSTVSKLLVTMHSGRHATAGTIITWTVDAAMTELAEAAGRAVAATNATLVVAQEVITAGSTTGTRTATASDTATGSRGISMLLKSAPSAGITFTVTPGTLDPQVPSGGAVALDPITVTVSLASLTATPTVNLSPVTVTIGEGTVVPTPSVGLAPVTVTLSLGALSFAPSVNLSPITVTVSLASLTLTPTVNLSPITATASLGTVIPRPTAALSPVIVTTTPGTLVPTPSVGLSPVTATLSLGTILPEAVTPGAVSLTPITTTLSLGTVSPRPTVGLSPLTILLTLGTVSARPTVGLAPISIGLGLGTVDPNPIVGLAPVTVTTTPGTLSLTPKVDLNPISVGLGLETVFPVAQPVNIQLSPVTSTLSLGTVAASPPLATALPLFAIASSTARFDTTAGQPRWDTHAGPTRWAVEPTTSGGA
jgi:hypothetical protein